MIIKKNSEIVKAKREKKSFFKAKKESNDEECFTFGSKDEEYAMAVRDFKKFLKRRDHLIRECPKLPKDKNQRAFVGGSWSDSGEEDDEKAKDKTCLVAQASNEMEEMEVECGCHLEVRVKFEHEAHYTCGLIRDYGLGVGKLTSTSFDVLQ
nr:hypothetical protein [Tanacetum cinerariifolium]